MTIEPTDEMVQLAVDKFLDGPSGTIGEIDGSMRDALADVLAIVVRNLSAGWLIWSNEHQMWWKSNSAGYTADMMCAGRYTLEAAQEATGFLKTDVGLPREVIVRAPSVELIGDRDLAGKMREAVQAATRRAMS